MRNLLRYGLRIWNKKYVINKINGQDVWEREQERHIERQILWVMREDV